MSVFDVIRFTKTDILLFLFLTKLEQILIKEKISEGSKGCIASEGSKGSKSSEGSKSPVVSRGLPD